MRVRQKIEDKRKEALLGGGQKRIDTQHAKVGACHFYLYLYSYFYFYFYFRAS